MDPFVAEVRFFGFTFAPKGWAFCQGQLMSISQNTALFSLLGTNYGGDGRTTFGLPNLQGAAVMGAGDGPGLTPRGWGETGGADVVTLLEAEMPQHTHTVQASQGDANSRVPTLRLPATGIGMGMYVKPGNLQMMSPNMVVPNGSSGPHNNMQPYQTLSACIALQGVYPPRD
jgi:microcystin-dependent protein